MNAKAKENNSAESDKLRTVIKWIDSILCKNLPALSFVKYTYVQIQMGKVEGGERHLLQRGRHPTATAKDEDSVQCLDCSLIEDEVGKKCIQNESAKYIKVSDVAWPSFILDLPRGDNRSLVDDQEKFPGVSSFNPDFSVS